MTVSLTTKEESATMPTVADTVIGSSVISAQDLRNMPVGTRILFDDRLHARFVELAEKMAKSSLCPPHLQNNPDACFAVIRMALNWNMDWFQVAASTYSPARGKIGIEGRLAVAAMLGSGKVREIQYRHTGDWDKVNGKFEMVKTVKNDRPITYAKATYTAEDEKGLGIIATAIMADGRKTSTPEILLSECHPRNSVQWNNSPRRQIINVASRALAQIAAADVMMGVHFDDGLDWVESEPIDVTPPKAVEPADIGVSGAGESEPGTDSGIVDNDWSFAEGDVHQPASTPTPGKKMRPKRAYKRASVIWNGKKMPKTSFVKQIKAAARDGLFHDPEEAAMDIFEACKTAGEEAESIWKEVGPVIMSQCEEGFDPETGEFVDDSEVETDQSAPSDELDLA